MVTILENKIREMFKFELFAKISCLENNPLYGSPEMLHSTRVGLYTSQLAATMAIDLYIPPIYTSHIYLPYMYVTGCASSYFPGLKGSPTEDTPVTKHFLKLATVSTAYRTLLGVQLRTSVQDGAC